MEKMLVEVILNPSIDVAKLNAGAVARGVVSFGENIKAIFEVDPSASMKAVEFKYLMPTESDNIAGFSFLGTTAFNDGETVISVYFKEM